MTACPNCGAPFTPVVTGPTLCDKCQGLAHPEPVSPLQHAEVAGYRLLHELGAGRYAHTWLAEDAQGQAVVLKLLRRYAPNPNAVQRFLAEAQRLTEIGELEHPNLARPITAGVHLVQAFFLVYQSGGEQTLADELRQRGRVLPSRALEFCAQVCEGLAVMHRAGLLHLDLKPANIGVTKAQDGGEQAVVLDLATSHLLSKAGIQDTDPLPLSSAAYLSPEQAAGRPLDARSDLYSVGILLFQLVSGRLPMMGATAEDLMKAHRDHPPLRLRDVGRKVHPDLEGLIGRLLSKDPAQRPGSGDEASVMMRAIVPVADTAPVDEAGEVAEDPVPVVEGPRPDPEVMAAPPRMLPPAVDPALERAMMGEVPVQPANPRPPGIPSWAAFVPPRWWPVAAGAGVIVSITAATMLMSQRPVPAEAPPGGPPPPVTAIATVSPVPAPLPPSEPVLPRAVAEAVHGDPVQDPATPDKPAVPDPPSAPAPRRAAAAVSPYSKNFDRAQKALWTNQPADAQGILHELMRRSLSRRDRARAARMMGDAEAKKGNRSAAAGWYRKSLKLTEDPDERAKLAKMIR